MPLRPPGLGDQLRAEPPGRHDRAWAWRIRDSGNEPSLYAVRPSGDSPEVIEYRASGPRGLDWEDIAYTARFSPGSGLLWAFDNIGSGWSGQRRIYQFAESKTLWRLRHG